MAPAWRSTGMATAGATGRRTNIAGEEQSETTRLFKAAQFGDDDTVTQIIKEMDRPKRRELIMACEFVLQTAEMLQRGSYRL